MRRIARIDRSIDLLKSRSINQIQTPYLCRNCKHRTASFSTSSLRAAQSNDTSLTEKLRRKIWGTDKPPGQENPYGDASFFDKTKDREAERKLQERRELERERALESYEPADTWDGLEEVGDYQQAAETTFKGFLPPYVMNDRGEIAAALHRALVEVFALRQAGRPLAISTDTPGDDLTYNVQLRNSPSGPVLDFGSQELFETIVQSLSPSSGEPQNDVPTASEEDVAADRSLEDPLNPAIADETAVKENPTESEEDVAADRSIADPLTKTSASTFEELIATWDPSWLQVSLEDPQVKFAVVKRSLQLTGVRLSDSVINSSKTVQHILLHSVKPPKPSKLVDALEQREDLGTLPNVNVFARRISPIDKEIKLGRWKLIEKELVERGLPVTGNN